MRRLPVCLAALAALLAGCSSTDDNADDPGSAVEAQLDVVRSATHAFHNLEAAVAAGYPRSVEQCLVHEQHGAMGYHHVNAAYVDETLDLERPEILLYERLSDGSYRLNAVEFIVPYAFLPRDAEPPVLLGERLRREDNLQLWYLHAWIWRDNPDGVFADFHPDVQCPPEDRQVFMPRTDPT
jgi:hypothetical protein